MAKKQARETFGVKLKKLRQKEKLSVDDLAAKVDMKPSYLTDLEDGKILPHVAEIIRISRALSLDPSAFVGAKPKKDSAGKKKKALQTRTDDYAYQVLTEEDHEKHLMAFKVTIDPGSDHKKVGYKHEGEEFIYVLSGKLKLAIDKKQKTMKAGESIRFDSGKKHTLKNPGKQPAVLIVVIFTP